MSVDPDSIRLETYQCVLLRHTREGREFSAEHAGRIFREHLEYVLHLVASGRQRAAGPVRDSPPEEQDICGLGLFQQDSLDTVRRLMEADPGVRQGLYTFDVMTWQTPAWLGELPRAAAPPGQHRLVPPGRRVPGPGRPQAVPPKSTSLVSTVPAVRPGAVW